MATRSRSGSTRTRPRPRSGRSIVRAAVRGRTRTIDLEPDFRPLIEHRGACRGLCPTARSSSSGSPTGERTATTVLRSATRSRAGGGRRGRGATCPTAPRSPTIEAGADGSVMVLPWTRGASVSNTKPSPSAPWGGAQFVGIGGVGGLAVGPDGGAVAVGWGCLQRVVVRPRELSPGGRGVGRARRRWGSSTAPTLLSVRGDRQPGGAGGVGPGHKRCPASPRAPGRHLERRPLAGAGRHLERRARTGRHLESDEAELRPPLPRHRAGARTAPSSRLWPQSARAGTRSRPVCGAGAATGSALRRWPPAIKTTTRRTRRSPLPASP